MFWVTRAEQLPKLRNKSTKQKKIIINLQDSPSLLMKSWIHIYTRSPFASFGCSKLTILSLNLSD